MDEIDNGGLSIFGCIWAIKMFYYTEARTLVDLVVCMTAGGAQAMPCELATIGHLYRLSE